MELFVNLMLKVANAGILAGFISAAFFLLRPVFIRLFTAQQRVVVWLVVWSLGYFPIYTRTSFFRLNFQNLIVARSGQHFEANPSFLPVAYEGPGTYHLAIAEELIPVTLTDGLVYGALIVWALGIAALCVLFWVQGGRLTALMGQGRKLADHDPMLKSYALNKFVPEGGTDVWIVPGLSTSFVRYHWWVNEICIQAELPPEKQELILLHEVQHVHLWHPWWKCIATVNLVLFWWNPMVWLGFRYFCRDLELACDASVMKKLTGERRRDYVRALAEVAAGRQLWDVPLAFGECAAQVRIRTAADWKPRKLALTLVTWCAALCVILFFFGGRRVTYPAADLALAYQREYGGMEEFARELRDGLGRELARPVTVSQVWEAPDRISTKDVNVGFSSEKGMLYETRTITTAALWVQTGDGIWYYTSYGWWGEGTNTFSVLTAEQCRPPDLTGAYQLIG